MRRKIQYIIFLLQRNIQKFDGTMVHAHTHTYIRTSIQRETIKQVCNPRIRSQFPILKDIWFFHSLSQHRADSKKVIYFWKQTLKPLNLNSFLKSLIQKLTF